MSGPAFVVTGATGHVGGEAARILYESGLTLRVISRNRRRLGRFDGAELIETDYNDPDALRVALRPGDRVFMVPVDASHDARMGGHAPFVAAAAAADVGALVYLSFINARADATFEHAVSHYETEELIRQSGLPFTFIRMSLYQASVATFFADGICSAPAGVGRASWVSRRDVGAAVAAVLQSDSGLGQTYNVTGPEALDLATTTERINDALGLDLRYVDEDDPSRMSLHGLPDPVAMASSRRSCFRAMAAGEQDLVTDDFQRLTGLTPAPFDRHVRTYPAVFRRLVDAT